MIHSNQSEARSQKRRQNSWRCSANILEPKLVSYALNSTLSHTFTIPNCRFDSQGLTCLIEISKISDEENQSELKYKLAI